MDTWYAITSIMQWMNSLGDKFVGLIRSNCLILDRWSDPDNPQYRSVKDLPWDNDQLAQGTVAKLSACSIQLKLFRLMVHPNRGDLVITNDHEAIGTSEEARKACAFRWKIEEYHREVKQVTGSPPSAKQEK